MAEFRLGRGYGGAVEVADTDDLERLAELSQALVGFLDPGALAQRTALDLFRLLELPLVSVAVREGPSNYAMRGVLGARTDLFRQVHVSTGEGLGGRVMVERRPVEVQNYTSDPRISNHFVDVVNAEGLGGMVAVPVEYDNELVGLLYGGLRSIGSIGDRAKIVLERAADNVAPMMATSIRASAAIQQHVDAERQRIASDLHDDVGQLLFSISVSAQRLRDGGDENLSAVAERIEHQAQEAAQRMRQAFKVAGPVSSIEAATVALQRELDDLGARSGLMVHFVVRGATRPLPPGADGVALAKSLAPDVVVLDLKLGDNFAPHLCRSLVEVSGNSRIVIHTAFDDAEPLRACLNAGAVGVVLKDASNLVDALRRVLAGNLYVDPWLVEHPRARAVRLGDDGGLYESLTQREYEVLCVMALGRTSKEIAAELYLAENTVRSYTQSLLSKLHARNRIEALAIARELRLL